ncbi:MAG: hypothetical protein ABIR33_06975 [Pyrinomonadaceae bacterium]
MNNEQPTTEHTEAPEQLLLPGMEELAAENESLKAELRMRSAVYDVKTRLAEAGAKSPGLLTDRAKETFQFSDAGILTNADAVVEQHKATYPEQFPGYAPPSIDASAGRRARPTLTKDALSRMTTAEIQRLDWNEVKATLAS